MDHTGRAGGGTCQDNSQPGAGVVMAQYTLPAHALAQRHSASRHRIPSPSTTEARQQHNQSYSSNSSQRY
jgi:hypothetical protein